MRETLARRMSIARVPGRREGGHAMTTWLWLLLAWVVLSLPAGVLCGWLLGGRYET